MHNSTKANGMQTIYFRKLHHNNCPQNWRRYTHLLRAHVEMRADLVRVSAARRTPGVATAGVALVLDGRDEPEVADLHGVVFREENVRRLKEKTTLE